MRRFYAQIVQVVVSRFLKNHALEALNQTVIENLIKTLVTHFSEHSGSKEFSFSVDTDSNTEPTYRVKITEKHVRIYEIQDKNIVFRYKFKRNMLTNLEASKEDVEKEALKLSLQDRLESSLTPFEDELNCLKSTFSDFLDKKNGYSIYMILIDIVSGLLLLPKNFFDITDAYIKETQTSEERVAEPEQEIFELDEEVFKRFREFAEHNIPVDEISTVLNKLMDLRHGLVAIVRLFLQYNKKLISEVNFYLESPDEANTNYHSLVDLKMKLFEGFSSFSSHTISTIIMSGVVTEFLLNADFDFPKQFRFPKQDNALSMLGAQVITEDGFLLERAADSQGSVLETHIRHALVIQQFLLEMMLKVDSFIAFFGQELNYFKQFKNDYLEGKASNKLIEIRNVWAKSCEENKDEIQRLASNFEDELFLLFESEHKTDKFNLYLENLIDYYHDRNLSIYPRISHARAQMNEDAIWSLYQNFLTDKKQFNVVFNARKSVVDAIERLFVRCETKFFTEYMNELLASVSDPLEKLMMVICFHLFKTETIKAGNQLISELFKIVDMTNTCNIVQRRFNQVFDVLSKSVEDESYYSLRVAASDNLSGEPSDEDASATQTGNFQL